jgi:glycosyltransferase 2 family protein
MGMTRKSIRILISLLIGGLFLWLALKDVSFSDVRLTLENLTYYWLLPYLVISLLSIYLRAERWKQLIDQEGVKSSRITLFNGVMLGYLVNYAVPRLGELSRSVFVGNREQISRTRVIGTVVLERMVDVLVMIVLSLFVFIYLFTDYRAIAPVLGSDTVRLLQAVWSIDGMIMTALLLLAGIMATVLLYLILQYISTWVPSITRALQFLQVTSRKFLHGLFSIKDVRNWPLFVLLTAGIWVCYVLMTYLPFTAFNMHSDYQLGMQEALVITVISSLGVALPSPGGIGTYHWFVSRSLLLFFAVPEAVGVSYAIVSHLVMMIIILVVTPILLVWDSIIRKNVLAGGLGE